MPLLVIECEEGTTWLNQLPRRDEDELIVAATQTCIGGGVWQTREVKDNVTGKVLSKEEVFVKVDPLGDWIEDHGGKREWSDLLMVVGIGGSMKGESKSYTEFPIDAVRVNHAGMDKLEDES